MQVSMPPTIFAHVAVHLIGESATQPIAPRYGTPAALLLSGPAAQSFARHQQSTGLLVSELSLAGMSPLRCRALLAHRITAHSAVSNCRF
jgi:hypothetical protein